MVISKISGKIDFSNQYLGNGRKTHYISICFHTSQYVQKYGRYAHLCFSHADGSLLHIYNFTDNN